MTEHEWIQDRENSGFLDELISAFDNHTKMHRAQLIEQGETLTDGQIDCAAAIFAFKVANAVTHSVLDSTEAFDVKDEVHEDLWALVNRLSDAWEPIVTADLPEGAECKKIIADLLHHLATPSDEELNRSMEPDTGAFWMNTQQHYEEIQEFFNHRVIL